MKRLLLLALAVLLTFPLSAAPKRKFRSGSEAKARQLAGEPGRLSRLLEQYREARNGIGASAIGDGRSVRVLVFPAAGNARGAGGEFFRSDVTLISFNETDDQDVVAFWLKNGADTDDPPAVLLTLEPNLYYTFTDFVGETLERQNELGSILIVPINAGGDIDLADASLDGFSRIWTNQPGATGTVSQPFEAVDPYSWFVFETASMMGLRHDAQYRSNYGLVNVHSEPLTFNVKFLGDTATNQLTITVPANGMVHQAIPAGNYGHLVIEVTVDNPNAPWIAYGTSNDNTTGDGWVSIGSGILTPADLDEIDGGL